MARRDSQREFEDAAVIGEAATATIAELSQPGVDVAEAPLWAEEAPLAVDPAADTDDSGADAAGVLDLLPGDHAVVTRPGEPVEIAIDPDLIGQLLLQISPPAHGTVTVAPGARMVYTPHEGFYGTDSFTYSVGLLGLPIHMGSVHVTVLSPPEVIDDEYTIPQGGLVDVGVSHGLLANDYPNDERPYQVVDWTQPEHGALEVDPDGSFRYTPAPDFFGTVSFEYTVVDSEGIPATATVTIDVVERTNTPPNGVDDVYEVVTGGSVVGNVLGNDIDIDPDTTLSAILAGMPMNGSLSFRSDGGFVYIPYDGFSGVDTFTYTVTDGKDTANATVTIVVFQPNQPPVAAPDSATVRAGEQIYIDVLKNDSDPDGNPLRIVEVSSPESGYAAPGPGGTIEYIADDDYAGTVQFTYTVVDDEGGEAVGTVTITVIGKPPAPVAVDDKATTQAGTPVTIDVLANDRGEGVNLNLEGQPDRGTATLNDDGHIVYTPRAGFHGTDWFNYSITTADGRVSYASVEITVTKVNTPPVAEDSRYTTVIGTALAVLADRGVLAAAFDEDGDELNAVMMTNPERGTLKLDADGSFTYIPDPDFIGFDSFTYLVTDGQSKSEPVTVTIEVVALEDAALLAAGGGGGDAVACTTEWYPEADGREEERRHCVTRREM